MSDCDCDEVLVAVTLCVTDPVAASEPDTHCVAETVRVALGVSDDEDDSETLSVPDTDAGVDTVADRETVTVGVPLRHSDALPVSDACDGLPDSV